MHWVIKWMGFLWEKLEHSQTPASYNYMGCCTGVLQVLSDADNVSMSFYTTLAFRKLGP